MRRRYLNIVKSVFPQRVRNSLAPAFHSLEDGYAAVRSVLRIRRRPEFLIIGAQKSGTTTLFSAMAKHEGLSEPFRKEVGYFDRKFDRRSHNWYLANFSTATGLLTGEATPDYLFSPEAPGRIKASLPEVQLIAILRDPVSRAMSHYYHEVRLGRETLAFGDALEREEARLSPDYNAPDDPASRMSNLQRRHHFSYMARGMYGAQLERWMKHFPAEQMHVLKFEDLKADVIGVANDALDFIGLSPDLEPVQHSRENEGAYNASDINTPEVLLTHFDEDQALLRKLVGFTVLNG